LHQFTRRRRRCRSTPRYAGFAGKPVAIPSLPASRLRARLRSPKSRRTSRARTAAPSERLRASTYPVAGCRAAARRRLRRTAFVAWARKMPAVTVGGSGSALVTRDRPRGRVRGFAANWAERPIGGPARCFRRWGGCATPLPGGNGRAKKAQSEAKPDKAEAKIKAIEGLSWGIVDQQQTPAGWHPPGSATPLRGIALVRRTCQN